MNVLIRAKQGFTLVELIIVMILVGIIAVAASQGYIQTVQGLIFTKMNAATIQKGQIAVARLVKEFTNTSIGSINPATATTTSITFTAIKNAVSTSHTVAFSGGTVTLDGDLLTDQVSDFALRYYDNYDSAAQPTWQSSRRIIEITLKLTGANNVTTTYTQRVKPRNL